MKTYICSNCNHIHEGDSCPKGCQVPQVPYTGGQSYKRKDGKYSWKFFVDGDQRAKGTNQCKTLNEATWDFIDIFSYQPCGEK